MKTGIELIAKERKEQIEKHGYDAENDAECNDNELIKGALFAINPNQFEWPYEWGDSHMRTINKKCKVERLAVAGAFIAAEIDRLQNESKED